MDNFTQFEGFTNEPDDSIQKLNALLIGSEEIFKIRSPKLISVAFTAVYDTGLVQIGAVVHDGSDNPLTVEFKNSTGNSTSL